MPLSLRHIEIFNAVVSAGGITPAARQLRTSQPTVSREIRELERLVGFRLFNRDGRRLRPTDEALSLHAEVRRSFVGLDRINRTADSIREQTLDRVTIACLPVYAQSLLPPVCRVVMAENPAIHLTIHVLEQPLLLHELGSHNYDICILEAADTDEAEADVTRHEVGNEVCVFPRTSPLARKRLIRPADLAGMDFIYFSDADAYRQRIDKVFEEQKVQRRLAIESTTVASICALIEAGVGVSIINPLSALTFRGSNFAVRRFSVPIPYAVQVYASPRSPNRRLVARIAEVIARQCEATRQEHF